MKVGPIPFELYLAALILCVAFVGSLPFLLAKNRRLFPYIPTSLAVICLFLIGTKNDSFAGIHIIYAVATWSLPIIGVVALISIWRKRRTDHPRFFGVLAVIFLLPAPMGYYATNIEPRQLTVDRVKIGAPTTPENTLRVVLLSDIQSPSVGSFERKAARTASNQNGDVMLYAGDLYSGEDEAAQKHFDDFVGLAGSMNASNGTYFVPGDHDGDAMLPKIVNAANKTFLQQDLRVLDIRGMKIGILGLDTDFTTADANRMLKDLAARSDLDYKIVLDHKPDAIFNTPAGIDLVVAGHTHGGQVNLPFYGPVMTLSTIPRKQAAGGLFDYSGERKLFVTSGVGVEHGGAPVVRFNDKPEIAVLEIGINK